jgi:DHA1 family bicyclomycin/chloramphenicol resistance-like MFS transporter
MSTDMYLPAFPSIHSSLGLQVGQVELSFSAYFVGMLLGMLCYGPISDRFGRRPPLLFGLVLYSLASLLLASSDSLAELIFWRFSQGLGGCAGAVLTVAIPFSERHTKCSCDFEAMSATRGNISAVRSSFIVSLIM